MRIILCPWTHNKNCDIDKNKCVKCETYTRELELKINWMRDIIETPIKKTEIDTKGIENMKVLIREKGQVPRDNYEMRTRIN